MPSSPGHGNACTASFLSFVGALTCLACSAFARYASTALPSQVRRPLVSVAAAEASAAVTSVITDAVLPVCFCFPPPSDPLLSASHGGRSWSKRHRTKRTDRRNGITCALLLLRAGVLVSPSPSPSFLLR